MSLVLTSEDVFTHCSQRGNPVDVLTLSHQQRLIKIRTEAYLTSILVVI